MSFRDNLTAAATAFDGGIVGLGLSISAAISWSNYFSYSSALRRIHLAPSPSIPDLRSLLSSPSDEHLVVVRGHVNPVPTVPALACPTSGQAVVIAAETQTCFYKEWIGFFKWRSSKNQITTSFKSIPFTLAEGDHHVRINLGKSTHPLPLTTIHRQFQPVQVSLIQAILGKGYPIALANEEKILPVGERITAIGICTARDGEIQIRSCQELPYFLSEKDKDEIEGEIATAAEGFFWGGVVLGALSVAVVGYAVYRNWRRWKEAKERRRRRREGEGEGEGGGDCENLCVVCLKRGRESAFVPCGHSVCCNACALIVQGDSSAKCPVCSQSVWRLGVTIRT